MLKKMITLFLLPGLAWAANTGIGGLASSAMSPVQFTTDFIGTGCLVIGVGFIFASIVKYIEHRRSPLMVSLTTVVFLLIAGIILVLLPFLPLLTGSGVPYTLFKT